MPAASQPGPAQAHWWQGLGRYEWFVMFVAGCAWLFDTLDQRLFSLARIPALSALMHLPGSNPDVQAFGKVVTALFLIGWGVGGLTLGALGDRLGRAKMLTLCILLYSICTGLSALSRNQVDFAILRFVTGLGIGGVFGLAVSLIAESVPNTARLAMLGILQLLAIVGNISSALIKMGVDAAYPHPTSSWRLLFLIGALPALLAVGSGFFLRESPAWLALKRAGDLPRGYLGSYRELFSTSALRRNLLIGSLLAISGVVGLWAIGEYAVDLQDAVFTAHFKALGGSQPVAVAVAQAKNNAYLLQMLGGGVGTLAFTFVASRFGRKPAFLIGFISALVLTNLSYLRINSPADAYWMMPLMGAAQFSVFAGFSIYLPELFGSRVRSTGVSFAYNLGRFAAAGGSFFSAMLATKVFGAFASPTPLRYSAAAMSCVFLVGIVATLFAPETRGRPLPE
ncbi:MAG: transporter [Caulobacteraceae bacterium]|nr:transporter [Caulobacteraceae bacterium]